MPQALTGLRTGDVPRILRHPSPRDNAEDPPRSRRRAAPQAARRIRIPQFRAWPVSDISIRDLAAGDLDEWRVLWDGYNAFYGRAGATALPEDITRLTWARLLDPSEPMQALVAECGGTLVGLAHIVFHRSTTLAADTCYLQDLFTAHDARGQGVGRQLIDAVYERARNAGSSRVYWQTHETNATAMRLYDQVAERSGFLVYRKLF